MSDVIGKRMPLKKHGREYQGLCPFHNEKSPSFTVNDEKAFFHCFGCGAHGDAIEFVRRFDRMTYPEAVEQLARDYGVALPTPSEDEAKKFAAEKTLYEVLEAACQWFEKQLHASAGEVALDYARRRGLKPETLRLYRIGFSPDNRTALYTHLMALGFNKKLQQEAGLIIVPDEGAIYDRFRGRLMFPIRNASSKVIAFGGRLIGASTNKSIPKYLNSPETPLFKKGEVLYNLDLAKRPAREANMAVVMEGYMDVVSCSQGGVPYGLATLGTAVTPDHLRLLWQLAKEPVLCLDGDAAGMRAMQRAAEVALPLLKPGFSLRFATLPSGEDPDTYIAKHGKASFEKLLAGSRRLSQVIWDMSLPPYDMAVPEDRAALENQLKQTCKKITDATVRSHYLSFFRKLLWAKGSGGQAKAQPGRSVHVEQMMHKQPSAILDTLAQRLLNVVMRYPEFLNKSDVEETLSRIDIINPQLDSLRCCILATVHHLPSIEGGAFIDHLQAQLPGLEVSSYCLSFMEQISPEDALYLWTETLSAYQVAHIERELKDLQESVGASLDEKAYFRMVELQEALGKAHAGRLFAPAEGDAA